MNIEINLGNLPPPKSDAQSAFETANSFFEGAIRCGTPVDNPLKPGTTVTPMSPTVVSIAFAAELYLKALLFTQGKSKKDWHRLDKLFNELASTDQKTIRNMCCKASGVKVPEFKEALTLISNAFIEWRYVYEGAPSIPLSFLFHFSRSLYQFVRNEQPTWVVDAYLHSRIVGPLESPVLSLTSLGGGRFIRLVGKPQPKP